MNHCFCTIITPNYIHYAMTLFDSISKYSKKINFIIGISHEKTPDYNIIDSRISFVNAEDLKSVDENALNIYKKYYNQNHDHFRWSIKPILVKYILKKGYDRVIFLDPDLHFCSNFDFLFDDLLESNMLLTPHWRSNSPSDSNSEFKRLFQDGLYNAGFFGVNQNAIKILDWWASACAYKCKRDYVIGLHDDQGYLDILPVYFDKVKVLEHQGCNIASWNIDYCKRSIDIDGNIKINNKWEIIFIHMTPRTIKLIENGRDYLLKPYLEEWRQQLEENRKRFLFSPTNKKSVFNKLTSTLKRNFLKLKKIRIIIEE